MSGCRVVGKSRYWDEYDVCLLYTSQPENGQNLQKTSQVRRVQSRPRRFTPGAVCLDEPAISGVSFFFTGKSSHKVACPDGTIFNLSLESAKLMIWSADSLYLSLIHIYQKKAHKEDLWYKQLPSQTAQEVCRLLDKAWKSFYALKRTGGIETPRDRKSTRLNSSHRL